MAGAEIHERDAVTSSMRSRTREAEASFPRNNKHHSWCFLALDTMKRVCRDDYTAIPATTFIIDRLYSNATSSGFLVDNSRRLVVDSEVTLDEDVSQEVLVDPAANMEFVESNLLPERPVEHPFKLAAQDSQEPIEEVDPP
jgi:hypothetical protein